MCVTVAMALFAFGMARLIASWRHARANGVTTPGLDGVAYALAGTWAGHLATFCVTAMQCGVGVTYYIFVAENVDMLAPSRYNLTMGAVILAMAVLEAPLSLFKRLQRLHGLNAAGNMLVALALFPLAWCGWAVIIAADERLGDGEGGFLFWFLWGVACSLASTAWTCSLDWAPWIPAIAALAALLVILFEAAKEAAVLCR